MSGAFAHSRYDYVLLNCVKEFFFFIIIIIILIKGTQTYRNLPVVDATICTLSNKIIITSV
jgi:hypothetical protein